jgi:hypothetical protein
MQCAKRAADEVVARRRQARAQADYAGSTAGLSVGTRKPELERKYGGRAIACGIDKEAESFGRQSLARVFAQLQE